MVTKIYSDSHNIHYLCLQCLQLKQKLSKLFPNQSERYSKGSAIYCMLRAMITLPSKVMAIHRSVKSSPSSGIVDMVAFKFCLDTDHPILCIDGTMVFGGT